MVGSNEHYSLFFSHSNGISALQLQSQLGLGSNRTAWMLCAKLRRAMVNPEREPLCGIVEADETIIPAAPRPIQSSCPRVAAQSARCWSQAPSKSMVASRGVPG